MMVAQRKCDNFKTCDNAGRYLAVDGRTLCGLCSMGVVAVRIFDLPKFIELTHSLLGKVELLHPEADEIRSLLPRNR